MNLSQAMAQCLQEAHLARAASTVKAYKFGLDKFTDYLESCKLTPEDPLAALTIEHFIHFPAFLMSHGYAKKSIGVYLSGVRMLLDWIIIQGHILPSYAEGLRLEKAYKTAYARRESKLPRFPAREDVDKMLAAVRTLPYPALEKERNIALMEFLASTGCRVAESTSLKIKDMQTDRTSAVVTGKGSKERRIFLSETATKCLLEYWQARKFQSPENPVFSRHDRGAGRKCKPITTTTVRNVVSDVAAAAGIENFSPHYFRHAFAIKLLQETGNLALVQDLLGHADPKATRIYAKIYADDLRSAHQKVFK